MHRTDSHYNVQHMQVYAKDTQTNVFFIFVYKIAIDKYIFVLFGLHIIFINFLYITVKNLIHHTPYDLDMITGTGIYIRYMYDANIK